MLSIKIRLSPIAALYTVAAAVGSSKPTSRPQKEECFYLTSSGFQTTAKEKQAASMSCTQQQQLRWQQLAVGVHLQKIY